MCNVCPRPRGLCSLDLAWSRDLRLSGPPSIDHMNLCLTQTTHVDWSIRRNGPAFLTYKLDYKCEEARILSWISILLSSILLGFESLFENSLYQIRNEKFFHSEFTYQISAEGLKDSFKIFLNSIKGWRIFSSRIHLSNKSWRILSKYFFIQSSKERERKML